MIITDAAWVQITTDAGALIQKPGSGFLSLAYATAEPTTEGKFALVDNQPLLMPPSAGKNIYAKSTKGDISITVEAI